jgi:hypothetical protein
VGLTQKGNRIEASIVPGRSDAVPTVLLVGGFAGNDETSKVVNDEIRKFEALADHADIAVVYYAGHGVQIAGDKPY